MLKGIKVQKKEEEIKQEDLEIKPRKKWKKEENYENKQVTSETLRSICSAIWKNVEQGQTNLVASHLKQFYQDHSTFLKQQFNLDLKEDQFQLFEEPEFEEEVVHDNQFAEDLKKEKAQNYNYDKITQSIFSKCQKYADSETIYDSINEKDQHTNLKKINQKQKYILASCNLCLDNKLLAGDISNIPKIVLDIKETYYLMLPKSERYQEYLHFSIFPQQHAQSSLELEDDEFSDIQNIKNKIVKSAKSQNMTVVFFELAKKFSQLIHTVQLLNQQIEVIIVPSEFQEDFPIYFKKSLLEIESEWNVHKKIINLSSSKGGIRKQIPKNFEFFSVEFNNSSGYAHIIEDADSYDNNNHHDVMASILGLDKFQVLRPQQSSKQQIIQKKKMYAQLNII